MNSKIREKMNASYDTFDSALKEAKSSEARIVAENPELSEAGILKSKSSSSADLVNTKSPVCQIESVSDALLKAQAESFKTALNSIQQKFENGVNVLSKTLNDTTKTQTSNPNLAPNAHFAPQNERLNLQNRYFARQNNRFAQQRYRQTNFNKQ